MNGLKMTFRVGLILCTLPMIWISCLEKPVDDIRLDNQTAWKPDLSLPIGKDTIKVNNYFEKFTIIDSFPRGIFPVYYEDSLFELDVLQIKSTRIMQGSLSDYVDSLRYVEYLSLHIRVWNTYPTFGKMMRIYWILYLIELKLLITDDLKGKRS